jgi:hypothetical protein
MEGILKERKIKERGTPWGKIFLGKDGYGSIRGLLRVE